MGVHANGKLSWWGYSSYLTGNPLPTNLEYINARQNNQAGCGIKSNGGVECFGHTSRGGTAPSAVANALTLNNDGVFSIVETELRLQVCGIGCMCGGCILKGLVYLFECVYLYYGNDLDFSLIIYYTKQQ